MHYNVGIPLSRVHWMVNKVSDNPGRDVSKDAPDQLKAAAFTLDSLEFGNRIGALYAYRKFINLNPPSPDFFFQHMKNYANIPDKAVQEVRSLATILASHVAMYAYAEAHDDVGLTKNLTIALARHNPAQLLAELPQEAREWLSANQGSILKTFEGFYNRRVPDHLVSFYKDHRGGDVASVLDYPVNSADLTVRDFMLSGLDENHDRHTRMRDIVNSSILTDLDRSGNQPLVVLELRSYGDRNITLGELQNNHRALSAAARAAYDQGLTLRNPSQEINDSIKSMNTSLCAKLSQFQHSRTIRSVPNTRDQTAVPYNVNETQQRNQRGRY
ncbi:hypothetical protein ACFWD7_57770 [Streptomyces mirabilis]|uniref:hypothetical protein n=1 Tax=Streptomyces mirabilis TaxID=68239 RepID=UPI00368C7BCF